MLSGWCDLFAAPKLAETATGDSFSEKAKPIIFKTPDYPNALYRVAVTPSTQADSAKMGPTLTRLSEEDMTLSWHNDPTTKETILQGMGDQHIDVAIRKAKEKIPSKLGSSYPHEFLTRKQLQNQLLLNIAIRNNLVVLGNLVKFTFALNPLILMNS